MEEVVGEIKEKMSEWQDEKMAGGEGQGECREEGEGEDGESEVVGFTWLWHLIWHWIWH